MTGCEGQEPDGEAAYAHYALHRLHILPSTLLALPVRERAFLYASISQQVAAEKRAARRAKKPAGKGA